MTELDYYIKSYFGVFDVQELSGITTLFKKRKVAKGEYILHTGRKCEELCFVQSGMMRIFACSDDKEVTQWISTKGYFVTDLSSFVFSTPARWTIQALNDVDLFVIGKADYDKLGDTIPEWFRLEKLFIARCFTILEDRIFSHLSMTAEERYIVFFEHNKELFNQVPLQYIASMLGMTPETFSRIRKKQLG